jgi:large subunit ribosomal protein L19
MNEIKITGNPLFSKSLIEIFEKKYKKENLLVDEQKNEIKSGDIIQVNYSIPEGDKERIQIYEGIVLAIKNRGINKTFTLRRFVQGIGVEQIFCANSPKIQKIIKKQSSKMKRAKLYFLRKLSGNILK